MAARSVGENRRFDKLSTDGGGGREIRFPNTNVSSNRAS